MFSALLITPKLRLIRSEGDVSAQTGITKRLASCNEAVPGNNDTVCPSSPMPNMMRSKTGISFSPILKKVRISSSYCFAEPSNVMPSVRIGCTFSSGMAMRLRR